MVHEGDKLEVIHLKWLIRLKHILDMAFPQGTHNEGSEIIRTVQTRLMSN